MLWQCLRGTHNKVKNKTKERIQRHDKSMLNNSVSVTKEGWGNVQQPKEKKNKLPAWSKYKATLSI